MSEHTPGPWSVEPYDKYQKDIIIIEPRCSVDNDDVDHEEAEANARLIAAAPDLLEALQAVVAIADRKTVEFDRARTAIAKATGNLTV